MRAFVSVTVLTTIFLTACGGGGGDAGTPPEPIRTPASVSVGISSEDVIHSFGDTRTLSAIVKDSVDATIGDATVTWTSSAPAVVSVSPTSGLSTTATALGNGSATITATSGTKSAGKTTTVLQTLATVAVTPAVVPLSVSGTRQLTAFAQDARGNTILGATGFQFGSNNEAVATVTPTGGFVSAVAAGSATITATLTRDLVTASGTSTVNVSAGSTFPTTATVATDSRSFSPTLVDIVAGGTITWTFGITSHNVNFNAATGAPANIATSENTSVARSFPTAGSFSYFCNIHEGMTGTVVVH
jgi:plastocyanin